MTDTTIQPRAHRCATCDSWCSVSATRGQCRGGLPKAFQEINPVGIWPLTMADAWCAAWKPLPVANLDAGRQALVNRVAELEAEVEKLQGMIEGLTDRVAGQSELLGRTAEKGTVLGKCFGCCGRGHITESGCDGDCGYIRSVTCQRCSGTGFAVENTSANAEG